jgi:two-component system, OmpR family, KDP operon response regulator KdpE
MATEPLVLVIEDDRQIRRFLRASLSTQSYRIVETDKGREGLSLAASHVPDVVVLDLGLPDMEGVDVIRDLRKWSAVHIIIISARGQERDKIASLDAGADDYLTKPFGVGELLARIRVALRRSAERPAAEGGTGTLRVGDLEIDLEAHRSFLAGTDLHLTPIEFRLLTVLMRNAGKVLTHTYLLNEVWGPGRGDQSHYVRIYMAGLRRKIEPDPARSRYIFTEIGVGYRFADE